MVASREVRERTLHIVRGLRLRHFLPAPLVLMLVLVVGFSLMLVPGLDFGWWSFIGGEGNPVFGQTEATAGTVLEWVVPLAFVTLLVPCLPLFAEREERIFRLGAERWTWRRRLWRSLQFGVIHSVIGIPVGVALALSLGGVYFTLAYLRGYRRGGGRESALVESTRTHLAYNLVIVSLALPALLVAARMG
jgi:hypothetical protein